ncbi:MAG TPA: sulfotransferase [Steroidobacteraceae bacterium]|nr:sulfotransferase [Steroidobacteraceae bacterium]
MSSGEARPASRIEAALRQLRVQIEGQAYAEVLDATTSLLEEFPENRDLLYLTALAQRRLGRVADALRTLERLQRAGGPFGRLYQERGHCYRQVGDMPSARAAYHRALSLNPTLQASRRALSALCGPGEEQDLPAQGPAAADGRSSVLEHLPRPLLGAYDHYYEGDLTTAARIVRDYLVARSQDAEALRLQASIATRLGALENAQDILERALEHSPNHRGLRADYAAVLMQQHDFERARLELCSLLHTDSSDRSTRARHAFACLSLGRAEEALQGYQALAREEPERADWSHAVGYAQQVLGRAAAAVDQYRRALQQRPGWGEAYWSLANLKTYRFEEPEIEAMQRALEAPDTAPADAIPLCFALGKALEDLEHYESSFRCYARGNAMKRGIVSFDVADIERETALQRSAVTVDLMSARARSGCLDEAPIFIVGMPRSGSTLIEQILASHPQVEGTLELAHITRMTNRLALRCAETGATGYPQLLESVSPAALRLLGETYLAETRPYRRGKARFIDKMPGNFRHLGLIHLILPNARIIDARRAPLACCTSNYKQLFAAGHEFTYALSDLARYYRAYVELMEHWGRALPRSILRVDHEHLVEDLEGTVRRLLEFCGLSFEEACIHFHETRRPVHTASSEQVRRPLFRDGLDHWRHFRPWLGELESMLGEQAEPSSSAVGSAPH